MSESIDQIPTLTIALRKKTPQEAIELAEVFEVFKPEDVGFKIANWHSGAKDLRDRLNDRYTILDTQFNDGVEEMALGAEWLVEQMRPSAITMSPTKEVIRKNKSEVSKRIFGLAHDLGAIVICHSEQIRHASDDPMLHENETIDCFKNSDLPFDAFELHADTVLSHYTADELLQLQQKREIKADQDKYKVPTFLASRFFGADKTEIINKAARVFRRQAVGIYLGSSIVEADSPLQLARDVIQAKQDAKSLSDEDFEALYPTPKPPRQIIT